MAKKKNGNQVEAKVEATLPLPLTNKQLEETADRAADLMRELDTKEEKFKLIKREWNADLKELRLQMRKFLEDYARKTRDTKVECKQIFDLEGKRTWYEHDGKRYQERDLDDYELAKAKQKGLFGDGPDLPGVIADGKDASQEDVDNTPLPAAIEDPQGNVVQGPF